MRLQALRTEGSRECGRPAHRGWNDILDAIRLRFGSGLTLGRQLRLLSADTFRPRDDYDGVIKSLDGGDATSAAIRHHFDSHATGNGFYGDLTAFAQWLLQENLSELVGFFATIPDEDRCQEGPRGILPGSAGERYTLTFSRITNVPGHPICGLDLCPVNGVWPAWYRVVAFRPKVA